jgi:hypothetical protein
VSSLAGIVGGTGRESKNRILPKPDTNIIAKTRKIYAEDFFTDNLKIEKQLINDFIFYADDHGLTKEMAKGNALGLIEFLIEQSKNYNIQTARI